MSLKFLHRNFNLRKKYALYLYRQTFKQTQNLDDLMTKRYFTHHVRQEYRKKIFSSDDSKIVDRFKLAEILLSNLKAANQDFTSVESKRLLRIAYNQSSVTLRNDPNFIKESSIRYSGVGVKAFPKSIDYKEKKLFLHVLDATINRTMKDKVDDKKLIEYFSEIKESRKDLEVRRPIPLRFEQYVNERIKYSDHKVRTVYQELFEIHNIPRGLFIEDLVIKPDATSFWKAIKTNKILFKEDVVPPPLIYN